MPTAYRGRAMAIIIFLVVVNALVWAAALVTFRHFALLVGTATFAYTFGLRRAVDGDYISAIDNVTRRIMQDGRRPLLVGFWFSLGHSTIVLPLSVLIASTAARVQAWFPQLQRVGGFIGTFVSAGFLLLIAAMNLLVLREVIRTFRRLRRGEPQGDASLNRDLNCLGPLGRVLRPVLRLTIAVGKCTGLDCCSDSASTPPLRSACWVFRPPRQWRGLRVWWILMFPALFTAGMCFIDTADGILMAGAYGWAYVHPTRKLYYNMAVTGAFVVVAVVVGGTEILNVIGDRFNFHGMFWNGVNSISNHFGPSDWL
jgi:high-affinity nickel-transport protein